MSKIKLKKIIFGDPPFRKLRNLDLNISDRITIIAGHNGIGKSTILGLIANCSGIKASQYKSYFDLNYDANFEELFFLSKTDDLIEDKIKKPFVRIQYEFDGNETLTKRCSVSGQTGDRLRVIPRTEEKELGVQLGVGGAGKIQLPTIYLGMSRMSPIGEYQKGDIEKKEAVKLDLEDAEYLSNCFEKVVSCEIPDKHKISNHRFKQSKKRSKVPEFTFDTLAISLGQDSLSSIITALASFKKIKNRWKWPVMNIRVEYW
jgi:predicted ATP-dependent endonuclease of OLD family